MSSKRKTALLLILLSEAVRHILCRTFRHKDFVLRIASNRAQPLVLVLHFLVVRPMPSEPL